MKKFIKKKASKIKRMNQFNSIKKLKLKLTKNKLPNHFLIESTNCCNLNCRLCSNNTMKRPKMNMTYSNFLKIFEQIKGTAKNIDFDLGGEPLLNPDTLKMVKKAKEHGIKTSFATNAHFLTKEKINEIFDSGLDTLVISFGGMSPENYLFYHEGGDFELAIDNIKNLAKEKIKRGLNYPFITISFLVTKKSEPEIPIIKKFAKEIKVDKLLLKSLHFAWADENTELKEFLPENKIYLRTFDPKLPCGLVNTMSIYSNGDCVTCCYDMDNENIKNPINVLEKGVLKSWKENYKNRVKQFNREFPLCKKCPQGTPIGVEFTREDLDKMNLD